MIALKYEYILNAMSRHCYNCVIASITLFQIIIQYYEDNENRICVNESLTTEFLQSVFMQLVTIIHQVKNKIYKFSESLIYISQ